jgi:aldehyde:ferredoxin oxidoreductase
MERGMISTQETDGLTLQWGDYETYIEAVRRIVSQPNDFYAALARGVEHAAGVYGGSDFALAFGGNEMPGYHTGPAVHLTYLTGARHSHLDSAGYGLDQRLAAEGETPTPAEVADALLEEERWRQVLSSLVVCFFARKVYTPETVLQALATAGFEFSVDDLTKLGSETLRRKYDFKIREGFDLAGLRIPGRILETPSPLGQLDEGFLRRAIVHYGKRVGRDG